MKYLLVQRKKDSEDSILIEKKEYTIRLTLGNRENETKSIKKISKKRHLFIE